MIRIAAMGDVHIGRDGAGTLRPQLRHVGEQADVLLIAGDLTRHGEAAEAAVLAGELADLDVPVIAVLGNHDYHLDQHELVRAELEGAGIIVLEGELATVTIGDAELQVAGMKGFGGGFAGACGSAFGEPQMKAFINHTRELAGQLQDLVAGMTGDLRVVLLHYAPCEDTLGGERLEIYPFLGSYLLGEAIDHSGVDLVLHGHAHAGVERGVTPTGIHVRNVAQHVLGTTYAVYSVEPHGRWRDRTVDGDDHAAVGAAGATSSTPR